MGDEERRMRYKIEAKEWGTQAQKKKSDEAHLSGIGMRRRQERDIKLELQKGEYKRKKNKKRSVRVCVREREGWGEWHKNKSY